MDAFEHIKMDFNCPKKLDELQPCGQNWSCNSCEKMVYDFRGMSEAQILDIFAKSGQKLCGIYEANRFAALPPRTHWQKWLSAGMLALGLSGFTEMVFAQQSTKIGKAIMPTRDTAKTTTFTLGEVAIIYKAQFKGGDEALQLYLHQQITNKENYKGTITATFTVEADGSVDKIKIVKSGGHALDTEMKNALQKSPKWIPVEINGKPVAWKTTASVVLGEAGK